MAGISSTIRLSDAMTPVLTNITGALHMTLNAFSALQTAANVNMNTTLFDSARASIQQADIALAGYQERLNEINRQPPVPPTPPQPPVPPQPQWQNLSTQQIFMNSGATRFVEEINATNSAMRQVLQTQQQLSTQAANLNILPSSALNDFNNVQERIHQVQAAMMEIQNIPLHLRTDSINNQLEVIREQMSQIGEVQNNVSGSLGTMNTQAANASLQQLNDMLENVTRHIRDINSQQIRPQWQNISSPQLFMNTGAERFLEEMNAANNSMREVLQTQQQISTQAMSTHLLSANALNDFNNVQEKVHIVQSALTELSNTPPYLRTDTMNNQIEGIRQQMQGVGTLQSQISNAIINMDTAGANASLQQLNDMMDSVMRNVRSINAQQITPQWQSVAAPPVFQNTGAERFQAEVAAANNAMERMLQVQAQVRASTASMRMLPANAQADIANMGTRMQQLAQKIQAINRIPVSMRTEILNNQLENLRGQFFQATQSAEALNRAMQGGDLSAANTAAQQLNASLGTAERTIRDNINAQNNFNHSVAQGTVAASGLESMIRRYGAAILSFAGVKKVLNLSDTLVQTNARIAMMAGGMDKVGAVQDQVFAAAQRARGNYQEMLDMVGKFGMRAKAAFGNTNETIKFAENLNKMYAIAGANQMEVASATLQLTQALGSGVLRGQELNAVFNAAPNVIQAVADYMEVPIGKIRELAAEGKVTASIVKNALLSATEDIDKQFSQMPTTFAQVMNSIANQALMAFQPVLTQISDITKSDRFQSMVTGIVNGLASVASMATQVFDALATGAAFVVDNWSIIEPLALGVATAFGVYTAAVIAHNVVQGIHNQLQAISAARAALVATGSLAEAAAARTATGAQVGWNTALLACPITWIIGGIMLAIGAFFALIAVINKVTGDSISATGLITGTLSVGLAAIKNTIFAAIELVFTLVETIVNPLVAVANFVSNLFNDPIGSIIHLFADMADSVLGIIEGLASAIDMVFGSSLASHVAGWRDNLSSVADEWAAKLGNGTYEAAAGTFDLDAMMAEIGIDLQRTAYSDAWDTGYDWGAGFFAEESGALFGAGSDAGMQYINDGLLMQGNYNTAAIADSTRDITDSLEISNEELKYMKDMAERDYINRFTTAENKVEVGNISIVANEAQDLDGMVDYLTQQLSEQMAMSASGYHNY